MKNVIKDYAIYMYLYLNISFECVLWSFFYIHVSVFYHYYENTIDFETRFCVISLLIRFAVLHVSYRPYNVICLKLINHDIFCVFWCTLSLLFTLSGDQSSTSCDLSHNAFVQSSDEELPLSVRVQTISNCLSCFCWMLYEVKTCLLFLFVLLTNHSQIDQFIVVHSTFNPKYP